MHILKTILHISEVDISLSGGMGRVTHHWKAAFEKQGYRFLHIGPREVGKLPHKVLFGLSAYRMACKWDLHPAAVIAHEPSAMFFIKGRPPVFIESHGIERRAWETERAQPESAEPGIKTRIMYPLWRLLPCDIALRNADKLLLINQDDKQFAIDRYGRDPNDIYVFRNGVDPLVLDADDHRFTVLFNGSWIARKGISTLVKAADLLAGRIHIHYLLIGGGKPKDQILADWPEHLHPSLEIVEKFNAEHEIGYLKAASVVVLPSSFEGQPLSILQAMQAGKCCIATNCCGQKDLISHDQNGLLFEVGDAAGLASLIQQCYYDHAKLERLGHAAKASVADRNWEEVSRELVDFITENIRPK